MANRVDIQYVRFYTDGSAAKKIAPVAPVKKVQPAPHARKAKRKVIRIDPVAIFSIAVCAALLICISIGLTSLKTAQQENARMAQYVQQLTQENETLAQQYAAGYDLNEIEKTALALGMVPIGQANHQSVQLQAQEAAAQPHAPSLWESILGFFANLFA